MKKCFNDSLSISLIVNVSKVVLITCVTTLGPKAC
jgi:hypothetical protein